jgi:hypothetical protein
MILESDPFRQPTIGSRRDSATTWTLAAEMEPHFPHLLEWSTDLQNWQPGQSITSTNGLFTAVQTSSNTPAQFYRIRSPWLR